MKKIYTNILAAFVLLIGVTACGEDFLTVRPSDKLEAGAPASVQYIQQCLGSAYQILLFDSYAGGNYNSITLMGDLRSDDLYKGGGDVLDQGQLYLLSQFSLTPDYVPTGWWQIYNTGLSRTNAAIIACGNATEGSEAEINRFEAEARFLRAYYVSQLWRMWGNIPYFEDDLPAPYLAKQYKADDIYAEIMEDLDWAIAGDKLPASVAGAEYGRVTKAAAQMLRARIAMYQNDKSRYNELLADMVEIINNPAYGLMPDFEAIFLPEGEFCRESIFEVNHRPEGKTWGNAWNGYGTNLPAFISPNSLNDPNGVFIGGWGFAPVRTEAYDLYAEGDQRRDASINDFRNPESGYTYVGRFQNTGLFLRKYAARAACNIVTSGDKDLNFDNNLRVFRLSEAYLNAAELVVGGATASGAQPAAFYLNAVRSRAFGNAFEQHRVEATLTNIKLERRLEFLGEGLRYWDLVRWGDAPTVLTETNPNPAFAQNRQWNRATDLYLPIPQSEMDNTAGMGEFELIQNPY